MNAKEISDPKSFLYKTESYAIRGAIFEVYNELGAGFLESVYQECLMRELRLRKIPVVSQPKLEIAYKGKLTGLTFQPDFICYQSIILELKAVKEFTDEHRSQTLNYLKASSFRLAMLVNFCSTPRVTIERFIL